MPLKYKLCKQNTPSILQLILYSVHLLRNVNFSKYGKNSTQTQTLSGYEYSVPVSWLLLQLKMATMASVKSLKGSLLSGLEPQEEWTDLAPMTLQRYGFGAVALDDGYRILVVGGLSRKGHHFNSVEVYDSRTNQWTSEGWPDLKVGREYFAATLCNNKVYVIGGYICGYHGNEERLDSIECLNLHSLPLEWKLLEARLSMARSNKCAVAVGKFVYVMGGYNGVSNLDLVEILDTETGLISQGPSLTTPRRGARAALVDNAIWVVGGYRGEPGEDDYYRSLATTVESIKVVPGTGRLLESAWMLCPSSMSLSRGYCPSVATIGQCLVVIGGHAGSGDSYESKSVEIFNTSSQEWWDLPNTSYGRNYGVAVTLGDSRIVALGGNPPYSNHDKNPEDRITVESLSFTHASSKVPSLAHLSELALMEALMERLPEYGCVNTMLDWAEEHNAVHLMKACLALLKENSEHS